MHIGVFILLLLSGERNFGVRLNKPYSVRFPMDIPVFTGSHADFLIIVRFHVVVTSYALTLGGILELRDLSVCLSHDAAAYAVGTLAACSLATACHQRCADCGPIRGQT